MQSSSACFSSRSKTWRQLFKLFKLLQHCYQWCNQCWYHSLQHLYLWYNQVLHSHPWCHSLIWCHKWCHYHWNNHKSLVDIQKGGLSMITIPGIHNQGGDNIKAPIRGMTQPWIATSLMIKGPYHLSSWDWVEASGVGLTDWSNLWSPQHHMMSLTVTHLLILN